MMKKIFTLFALTFITVTGFGQTEIVLKKPIWFYKKAGSINGRSILKEGTTVVYYPESDAEFFRATVDKKNGFVEPVMVSDAFQSGETQISKKEVFPEKTTSALTQDFSSLDLRLKKSGALISEGANQMLLGTVVSIGAAVAGTLLAKKNPTTGGIVVAAGGGLGLIFTIVGVSNISKGGKTLRGF